MGDQAMIVEFGNRIDPLLSAQIAMLAQRLRDSAPIGVLDIVPAYTTLALYYDPREVGSGPSPFETLQRTIAGWLEMQALESAPAGRTVEIPVCYGGALGEDLETLAHNRGLRPDEVVAIHSGATYHVHMLGFVPGFAYLGGLDERLASPRRATPRPRVPAGSVAIADGQTGIYPLETPGGWHLIGCTPLRLFRAEASPPSLLNAGDKVRFLPISIEQFQSQSSASA